jgi:plasmid stability protein
VSAIFARVSGAMVHHSLAAAKSRGKSGGEAGSEVGGESGDRDEGGGAGQDGESAKTGRGRRMSEERRQKISAAMKGRSKSAEHRRKLSARFTGESNPMYGRKLSKETRARISSALAASRAARKAAAMGGGGGGDGEGGEQSKEQAVPPGLQEKALRSRFITSLSGPTQSEQELDEEAALDDLLARVAAGLLPPAAIQRMRHISQGNTSKVDVTSSADKGDDEEKAVFVSAADASKAAPRRKNSEDSPWAKVRGEHRKRSTPAPAAIAAPRPEQINSGRKLSGKSAARRNALEKGHTEELPKCPTCLGSGSVVCEHCVGQVGVPSRHCTVCAGAAVTFCPECLGAGELQPGSPL